MHKSELQHFVIEVVNNNNNNNQTEAECLSAFYKVVSLDSAHLKNLKLCDWMFVGEMHLGSRSWLSCPQASWLFMKEADIF